MKGGNMGDVKKNETKEVVTKGYVLNLVEVLKGEGEGEDEYIFDITVQKPDIDKEVILVKGAILDRYKQNKIVLADHNLSVQAIVGKSVWVRKYNDRIRAKLVFADTAFGQYVKKLVDGGFLRAASIRFRPYEWVEGEEVKEYGYDPGQVIRVYTKWELLEWSIVTVPANPNALKVEKVVKDGETKAVNNQEGQEEVKGATPYQDYDIVDEKWDKGKAVQQIRKWASSDGSGDTDKIDWGKMKKAYMWFDSSEPEKITSYKLPYVYIKDGKPVAVKRAIISIVAAIMGARGGVNIPEKDKRAVYNHCKKYYAKMGMEIPEYKDVLWVVQVTEAMIEDAIDEVKKSLDKRDDEVQNNNEPEVSGQGDMAGDTQADGVEDEDVVVKALGAMVETLEKMKGGQNG